MMFQTFLIGRYDHMYVPETEKFEIGMNILNEGTIQNRLLAYFH
jgi:hypothetical protein